MKFICLGYLDGSQWNELTEAGRAAFWEACSAYVDELRQGGHCFGAAAMVGDDRVVTVRRCNGQVDVTAGPYAETMRQLGSVLDLEARDLNHAIQLMSHHPAVRAGAVEIRSSQAETKVEAQLPNSSGKRSVGVTKNCSGEC